MPYVIVYIQKYAEMCDFEKRSVRISLSLLLCVKNNGKKNHFNGKKKHTPRSRSRYLIFN